ncbi:MAG: hypothetical protein HSCHL_1639 [Hydrogenibacillus schlegelii]|uniref:Uncharacterized protein n=1 Tax=Hydrogenibacillus schlegelii TaxID=1484 RepID=A0A2T5G4A4_HYDSH|nr:MAG: hypothetical protein HSCHL_1639 [Hydrogenibacillus schlegelii]
MTAILLQSGAVLLGGPEQLLHGVGHLTMHGRSGVRVDVQRDGHRGMTKPLLHQLGVHPSRQQHGGMSMSQVVKPDGWQTGPLKHLPEGTAPQVRRVDRRANRRGEYQPPAILPCRPCQQAFFHLLLAVLSQGVSGHGGQLNRPPSFRRFRFRQVGFRVPAPYHLAAHVETTFLQVNILPPKPQQLPLAHACSDGQHVEGIQPIFPSGCQKGANLFRREGWRLAAGNARPLHGVGRVAGDLAPLDGLSKRTAQDGVNNPNCVGAQAFVQLLGVQGLNVRGLELVDTDVPQRGRYMAPNDLDIVLIGLGPNPLFLHGFHPPLQVRGQRFAGRIDQQPVLGVGDEAHQRLGHFLPGAAVDGAALYTARGRINADRYLRAPAPVFPAVDGAFTVSPLLCHGAFPPSCAATSRPSRAATPAGNRGQSEPPYGTAIRDTAGSKQP